VYLAERVRLTRRIADSRRALTDLDDLVRYLGDPRAHRVELVRLAGEQVAAAPFHTAHAEATSTVLRTIARLRHSLRGRAHTLGGPWGATFPLRPTERVSGFVFARTTRPLDRSEPDTAGLPSTRAARTTHHGGPATLDAAYLAVFDAIERRGWEPADPVIEEYLTLDNGPTRAPAIRLTVPIAPGWPYSRPAAAGPPCRGSEAAADQPG
jgi:effector-binding domain-containing protein